MLLFAYNKDISYSRFVLLKQENLNPNSNFKMSAINQTLSLFIPRVFISINEGDIKRVFKSLSLGIVSHVDFIAKRGKNRFNYNAVYIHFREWFNNTAVINFQENVLNPCKTAKLVYDDPWYWLVFENTVSKTQDLSASTWVPTSCLYKQQDVEDINWVARYHDYVASTKFSAVQSTCDTENFTSESFDVLSIPNNSFLMCENSLDFEDIIMDSKYARDVASQENEELRKENEEIRKEYMEICKENEELRKEHTEIYKENEELRKENEEIRKEVDAARDFEDTIDQQNSENDFIKYILEQQTNKLFYIEQDNKQLNREVKNLKDELQASYIELGDLREEFNRQKCELEDLRNLNEKNKNKNI